MKNLIYFSFIIVLLGSCSLANQYLKNGNYQAAIEVGAKKMMKNPKKADKTILAIERAFKIEKSRILGKINQLKIDGSPENWVSIYNLYRQLDQYQRVLKPVLPMFIKKEFRNADIDIVNIDQDLADTKLKAAEFLYLEADKLLAQNNKIAAREAYGRYKKVKELQSNFRDVDARIRESYAKGQNNILVNYTNNSQLIIPQQFITNLSRYNIKDLDTEWTKYFFDKTAVAKFDYAIEVRVQNINIGPEQIRESQYEDIKKVQDGEQYVLDGKGNVAKDTLGNDITEPRYINIKALITRTEQTKIGSLSGVVEFKDVNKRTFKSLPYREDLVFQNFFATMQGDQRALSKESQQLLGGRPQAFPTDIQMVMDAAELIKASTFNIIKSNVKLVYR